MKFFGLTLACICAHAVSNTIEESDPACMAKRQPAPNIGEESSVLLQTHNALHTFHGRSTLEAGAENKHPLGTTDGRSTSNLASDSTWMQEVATFTEAPQAALLAPLPVTTPVPCDTAFERDREGIGVMFFAYNENPMHAQVFLDEAERAAADMQKVSPQLKMALVTSVPAKKPKLWHEMIPICKEYLFPGHDDRNSGVKRQWATRIAYLAATPFQFTLAVDTTMALCADVYPVLQQLAAEPFDFAVVDQSPIGSRFYPRGMLVAFKWTAGTQALLKLWFEFQEEKGLDKDDQWTMDEAIIKLTHKETQTVVVREFDVNFAMLLESWNWRRDGNMVPLKSRLIDGPVYFYHWPFQGSIQKHCEVLNSHVGRRVAFKRGWSQEALPQLAFNQSDCELVAQNFSTVNDTFTCPHFDWAAPLESSDAIAFRRPPCKKCK